MATLREAKDRDIKTREGQLIYKRAVEQSGRIQTERKKHPKGSEEFKRLTEQDKNVLSDAMARALALNPKPKRKSPVVGRKRR